MIKRKTTSTKLDEDLSQCQVDTPHAIVKLFWKILRQHRTSFGTVADFGAGDGRFASAGQFVRYQGYEIDPQRTAGFVPGPNKTITNVCAFEEISEKFDAVIGNPPYLRHHKIEAEWRGRIVKLINAELSFNINQLCNFFAYFICLSILRTKDNGLIGLVIPYEWVSRPSLSAVRTYIKYKRWNVSVYRFKERIFPGVLTTASITIIDKASTDGSWKYYEIDKHNTIIPKTNPSGTRFPVLMYSKRSQIWALRGLSPGTQKVFTLTEAERAKHRLIKNVDVSPCITSLRGMPYGVKTLDKKTFAKYFVDEGKKCWLIRSDFKVSVRLKRYLRKIPKSMRDTYTCNTQRPWYKYKVHPAPAILFSPGFVVHGPKFLKNDIKAIALGTVYGVHSKKSFNSGRLISELEKVDFEKRVVHHAKVLKKVEVGQMNTILGELEKLV